MRQYPFKKTPIELIQLINTLKIEAVSKSSMQHQKIYYLKLIILIEAYLNGTDIREIDVEFYKISLEYIKAAKIQPYSIKEEMISQYETYLHKAKKSAPSTLMNKILIKFKDNISESIKNYIDAFVLAATCKSNTDALDKLVDAIDNLENPEEVEYYHDKLLKLI